MSNFNGARPEGQAPPSDQDDLVKNLEDALDHLHLLVEDVHSGQNGPTHEANNGIREEIEDLLEGVPFASTPNNENDAGNPFKENLEPTSDIENDKPTIIDAINHPSDLITFNQSPDEEPSLKLEHSNLFGLRQDEVDHQSCAGINTFRVYPETYETLHSDATEPVIAQVLESQESLTGASRIVENDESLSGVDAVSSTNTEFLVETDDPGRVGNTASTLRDFVNPPTYLQLNHSSVAPKAEGNLEGDVLEPAEALGVHRWEDQESCGIPKRATSSFNTQVVHGDLIDPGRFGNTASQTSKDTVGNQTNQESNNFNATSQASVNHDGFQPPSKYLIEPTVSTLEREILLRGESYENKKTTIMQLPPEMIPNTPSHGEREIVGDDVAKDTAHILCECEHPGAGAGAAVPMVASFTMPDSKESKTCAKDDERPQSKRDFSMESNIAKPPRPSLIPKLSNSFRNEKLIRGDKNLQEASKQSRNISFKCVSLPEKSKISPTGSKEGGSERDIKQTDALEDDKKQYRHPEDDEATKHACYKKLINEFSKQVSRLAQEASNLSAIKNPNSQTLAVDSLYGQIVNLKKIANNLKTFPEKGGSETIVSDRSENMDETQTNNETTGRSRSKDNNRIYIKFLPSKSTVKKRKSCNSEAQTHVNDKTASNAPESRETPEETNPKEVDSMDGMFIPSFDEPPKMEDEEDEDGLDITITFPELQSSGVQQADSHLSVCFSTISAEALGRLKRCPKEFTLRMDFVQGKMFFQSGKSPANNFAIGPDLKITECVLDSKRSDVISIKPSTECLYASQIIPVEGETARKNSIKILKSTDSELFNVVSLPFVNKRNSVATKSCITFKNLRRVSSESLLPDRTYYKSMPQIPSLTKILEEPALETVVGGIRTAMMIAEKKPRNRNLQQKRANASLENVLLDPC